MLDYVISLREGIMDAWGGIVLAMRAAGKRKSNDLNGDFDKETNQTQPNCFNHTWSLSSNS